MKTVPNDGLILVRGFFNVDQLFPTNAATLSEVLVHKSYHFAKPTALRNFLAIILGKGLIVVEGDEHKFQRKHVSPAFSFRNIKDLYPLFWGKALEVTEVIERESSEHAGCVEINHFANKVTMDIIGVAGAGRNFNTLKSSDDVLVGAYEEILEPTKEKAIYFVLNLILPRKLVQLLPWRLNQRLEQTTKVLRDECTELVSSKRALIKYAGDDHKDILSLLIKSNDFSNEMLVDQLLTFLAAG
jgi:cytochrome P450